MTKTPATVAKGVVSRLATSGEHRLIANISIVMNNGNLCLSRLRGMTFPADLQRKQRLADQI
jgi:hypothetical protein